MTAISDKNAFNLKNQPLSTLLLSQLDRLQLATNEFNFVVF